MTEQDWKKENDSLLKEICNRLGSVEITLERLVATAPILERLGKAENKIIEAELKALEEKVDAHRGDCVEFRKTTQARTWFFIAAIATSLIGAFFALILK